MFREFYVLDATSIIWEKFKTEGTVYSDLGHSKLERNQIRRISTGTLVEATVILTTQDFSVLLEAEVSSPGLLGEEAESESYVMRL